MNYLVMCKVYTDVGGIKQLYHVCPPVRKIIHSLKLVDYLHVQADNPWYNYNLSHERKAIIQDFIHSYLVGLKGLMFHLSLHLPPYFEHANIEDSGEPAQIACAVSTNASCCGPNILVLRYLEWIFVTSSLHIVVVKCLSVFGTFFTSTYFLSIFLSSYTFSGLYCSQAC